MQTLNRLQNMPVSFFAMVMGLVGLTIAWQRASELFHYPRSISNSLLMLSVIIFVVVAGMYLCKALRYRDALIKEWTHPIKMSFVPSISISLLLFSVAFLPLSSAISLVLWALGSTLHLSLSLLIINTWLHHDKFEIQHLNPAWFIPAVGNVIVPLAGVELGYPELAWFFFSIGMMFWLILMVIVFNRIFFHQAMPEKLLPTMFILIAPPAVGFLSYVKLSGGIDAFAQVLYNFALFLTLLLFSQLPRFVRLPFYMSWWAYSFPLAAMCIASMLMSHMLGIQFYGYVGIGLLWFLSLLIIVMIIKTILAAQQGSIYVEE